MFDTPEATVEAVYDAIRNADATTFISLIEPTHLDAYLHRLRTSADDQQILREHFIESEKVMPDLTGLSNEQLVFAALDSYPADFRTTIVKAVQTGRDASDNTWVRIQDGNIFEDGTIEMHTIELLDDFPPNEGVIHDRVQLANIDGRWYVVPMPFGVIPMVHYCNVLRWRTIQFSLEDGREVEITDWFS
jgi:hypothetical protein